MVNVRITFHNGNNLDLSFNNGLTEAELFIIKEFREHRQFSLRGHRGEYTFNTDGIRFIHVEHK